MEYTRISADCHIDLPWLPPDLFTSNASAAMKDRMPYVADSPEGAYWTCKGKRAFGWVNAVGPAGQKFVPGMNYRVDVMASTGLYDDGQKGIRRVTIPRAAIERYGSRRRSGRGHFRDPRRRHAAGRSRGSQRDVPHLPRLAG